MKTPLIWGHRGASGYAPENTLPSFAKAAELKADGIELDIQMTKDGQIVVCHDEFIDRTSTGRGFLKDYTLEQLRRFDFSNGMAGFENTPIPLMSEVFELIRPTDLTINIELKTGVFDYEGIEEKILAMTKEYGMEDRVIYSSFNHYSIKRIQALKPDAETAFLYMDGPIDMPAYAAAHGVDAVHPWFVNLRFEGFMEECRRRGLKVNTWTANEDYEIRFCLEYGADAIITNYPDRVRNIVNEVNGNA